MAFMTTTFRKTSNFALLPAMLLYIFGGEVCQAGTITYAYTYSADDELTSVTETQDSTQKVTNFVYDLNGNMTAVKDSSGNTLQSFSYNSLNQLINYADNKGMNFEYSYNAESLRSRKTNALSNKYISFYYDSSGTVVNETDGDATASYLIAHDRLLRAVGTDIYWYVRNGKDIVGTTSDGTKQNNTYAYSAYGKDIDLNSLSTINQQPSTQQDLSLRENPFKYSSTYQDLESCLYYLKARYYSPDLMRFISKDTYDLSNKYAYGNGNPISNVDPNGHLASEQVSSIVMASVGLFLSGIFLFLTGGSGSIGALALISTTADIFSGATQIAANLVDDKKKKEALNEASFASGILGLVAGVADIGVAAEKVYGGLSSRYAQKVTNISEINDLDKLSNRLFVKRSGVHWSIDNYSPVKNDEGIITHYNQYTLDYGGISVSKRYFKKLQNFEEGHLIKKSWVDDNDTKHLSWMVNEPGYACPAGIVDSKKFSEPLTSHDVLERISQAKGYFDVDSQNAFLGHDIDSIAESYYKSKQKYSYLGHNCKDFVQDVIKKVAGD